MAVAQAGQLVLFRFPQTNLVLGKSRPALLITPVSKSYQDWLVCMISSKTGQEVIGLDESVDASDKDFGQSGLKSESVIRVARLAVVSEQIFLGTIGSISQERLLRIKQNLAAWILR